VGATKTSGRDWLILTCTGMGILMPGIDATGINVVLPSIQHDLGASLATLQWTINAFLLAIAVSVITVGRLGDQFGRRRMYLLGLAIFLVGSVICGIAPDVAVLLAGRAVQGIGGAMLFTLSMALVRQSFPENRLGWAMGLYGSLAAVGLSLGPLVAGALSDFVSWRAFFLFNVPLVLIAAAITVRTLDEYRDEQAGHELDPPGVALLGLSLGCLVVALVQSEEWGWGSPATLGLIAAAVVALAVFVVVERRARAPLVDFSVFRSRTFLGCNVAVAIVFAVLFGYLFLYGLFFQNIQGDSPFVAGLKFLPYPLAFLVVASSVGKLVDAVGARLPIATGMAGFAVTLFALSEFTENTPEWLIVLVFAAVGVSNALVTVASTRGALSSVPLETAGVASGMTVTSRYVGGSLGVAVTAAIFQALESDHASEGTTQAFIAGMSGAMKVAAGVAVAGVIITLLTVSGDRHVLRDRWHGRRHLHYPHPTNH
jgi:EmrB/QacA subfamily drug resistance transporter